MSIIPSSKQPSYSIFPTLTLSKLLYTSWSSSTMDRLLPTPSTRSLFRRTSSTHRSKAQPTPPDVPFASGLVLSASRTSYGTEANINAPPPVSHIVTQNHGFDAFYSRVERTAFSPPASPPRAAAANGGSLVRVQEACKSIARPEREARDLVRLQQKPA